MDAPVEYVVKLKLANTQCKRVYLHRLILLAGFI